MVCCIDYYCPGGGVEPLQVERCLLPLLRRGVLPVVTGFNGAAADGRSTTLGRGGADFSASICGHPLMAYDYVKVAQALEEPYLRIAFLRMVKRPGVLLSFALLCLHLEVGGENVLPVGNQLPKVVPIAFHRHLKCNPP